MQRKTTRGREAHAQSAPGGQVRLWPRAREARESPACQSGMQDPGPGGQGGLQPCARAGHGSPAAGRQGKLESTYPEMQRKHVFHISSIVIYLE